MLAPLNALSSVGLNHNYGSFTLLCIEVNINESYADGSADYDYVRVCMRVRV